MDTNNEIILYQPDASIKLEVRLEDDTVWLTKQQMSDLFLRDRTVITRHINNIFKKKELVEESNVHFLHIANSDKPIKLYSLDVIISVGYRVKSVRGTQFRQWANKVLKEYLVRGYSINQRLLYMENCIDHRLSERQFHTIKIINDVVMTLTGIIIAWVMTGGIEGVREGTVVSAFLVGIMVKLFKHSLQPVETWVNR